ncbi:MULTISPECIES: hypothetical protein [unclassified Ensifer]|uniref:hypothetical protein n=1 Tax=unclassified Ensifer TaxID=2633371 RepID=UPI000812D84C|nr:MULTISPECIES: hypothetical protein [unclassified Ensifer]OCP21962.1 hypothetical protein BC361_25680 [Ensifer sp. LC54]OCP23258.1 hypothetical protein BC363_25085 [Ensifer sp. LC384]
MKPNLKKVRAYLRCDECGHVTATSFGIISLVKPNRSLDCGCKKYRATAISETEGVDALARQHVEAAA